jgi:hypothetical protein
MQTYLGTSRLSGVGMMFVIRSRDQESNTEIAFITDFAAEWANEKNSVKDLLDKPSPSGPVGYRAGAIRTSGRTTEDRHGPNLPFWLGPLFYIHIGHKRNVGIAKRPNVKARKQIRIAVRSLSPFLRQIVNPMETSSYRPPCSTLPSPYALVSCVDRRARISQRPKGNRS